MTYTATVASFRLEAPTLFINQTDGRHTSRRMLVPSSSSSWVTQSLFIWKQETGSSTVAAEEAKLRQLEEIYVFPQAATVRPFLRTHPQLVEALLEAYVYLQEYFGPEPQMVLEVVSDPEVEGWDELFAYILTALPVDEALARLDRFDQEWFLDQFDWTDGLLNFDVEFT
jgi:hypothetical protein